MQYSLTDEPEVLPFEPSVTVNYHDAVTRFQPTYFEVESIESAKRIFLCVACVLDALVVALISVYRVCAGSLQRHCRGRSVWSMMRRTRRW